MRGAHSRDMRRTFRIGAAAIAFLFLSVLASRAQQAPAAPCAPVVAPVCALKDGNKQSYWNECLAARDGAQLLYPGECRIARSPN
jgi:hypothetical protein